MVDQAQFEIVLSISAVGAADGELVEETWSAAPDGTDAYNVESMVKKALGEPTDAALERHEVHGVIQIGWYFAGDRLAPFGLPSEGNDALVIPHALFSDESTTPLYVLVADWKDRSEKMFGADHVTWVDARNAYEPPVDAHESRTDSATRPRTDTDEQSKGHG